MRMLRAEREYWKRVVLATDLKSDTEAEALLDKLPKDPFILRFAVYRLIETGWIGHPDEDPAVDSLRRTIWANNVIDGLESDIQALEEQARAERIAKRMRMRKRQE